MPILALGQYEVALTMGAKDAQREVLCQPFMFVPVARLILAALVLGVVAGLATARRWLQRVRLHAWLWLPPLAGLALTLLGKAWLGEPLDFLFSAFLGQGLGLSLSLGLLGLFRKRRRLLATVVFLLTNAAVAGIGALVTDWQVLLYAVVLLPVAGIVSLSWSMPCLVGLATAHRRFDPLRLALGMALMWLVLVAAVAALLRTACQGEEFEYAGLVLMFPVPYLLGFWGVAGFNSRCREELQRAFGLGETPTPAQASQPDGKRQ
jgi:hypothetical protein